MIAWLRRLFGIRSPSVEYERAMAQSIQFAFDPERQRQIDRCLERGSYRTAGDPPRRWG